MDDLRHQFQILDANGTGFIEKEELEQALKLLGYQISDDGFDHLLQLVRASDNKLNFDEFVQWNTELYKADLKAEFNAIDKDHSGWISRAELKQHAQALKWNLTEEQIDDFLYNADTNQNDHVGIDEYIAAVAATQTGKAYFTLNSELYAQKLKVDFQELDIDGDGFVTAQDLKQKAHQVSYTVTPEEMDQILQDMDANQDGKISLQEFIAAAAQVKNTSS